MVRRPVSRAVLVLSVVAVTAADAAVLCQKKQRIIVRAEACTGKETLVQDLGALDTLPGAIDQLAADARVSCPGAATRAKATGGPPGICGGGCRTFDGDEAGCNGAFALAPEGAATCAYAKGLCLPCSRPCGQRMGVCQNVCARPAVTCADPSRTRFGGGFGYAGYYNYGLACYTAANEVECEKTWHISAHSGEPSSCFWDSGDSRCRGCSGTSEDADACTNTCLEHTCADASRTVRQRCSDAVDQPTCEARWHVGKRHAGLVASCWWDSDDGSCRGCGLRHAAKGLCTNTCE